MKKPDAEIRFDASGPFILWEDYGCEGWKPRSFDSIDQIPPFIQQGCLNRFVVTSMLAVAIV
jgi:hypothetical protein